MDARTVAAAARVQVLTLNAWIHRGFVPGVSESGRGRGRNFDLTTATTIGLIAELVRLRVSPEVASVAARPDVRSNNKIMLLVTHPLEFENSSDASQGLPPLRERPLAAYFEDEAALADFFKKRGGAPASYTVINVELIAKAMRRAEAEWLEQDAAA